MDDQLGITWALARLGLSALILEDYERSTRLVSESLRISRALGDRWSTAWSQHLLSNIYTFAGEPEPGIGERLQFESLAMWRELGNRRDLALSLACLGTRYLAEGSPSTATPLFREALPIQAEIGDRFGILLTLSLLVGVAAKLGQNERAVRLDGAVASLRRAAGIPAYPSFQRVVDRELERARAVLGSAAAAAAHAAGQELTVEQAVEYALRGRSDS